MVHFRFVLALSFLQLLANLCDAFSSNCYWAGTPPNCDGSCQPNEYLAGISSRFNGTECTSGSRKYCCLKRTDTSSSLLTAHHAPTLNLATAPVTAAALVTSTASPANKTDLSSDNCRWVGEGPNCTSVCNPGERIAAFSSENGGNTPCQIGSRKYCCKIVARPKYTTKPIKSEDVTTQKPVVVNLMNETNVTATVSPNLLQTMASPSGGMQMNQAARGTTFSAIISPSASTFAPFTPEMDSGSPAILVVDNSALRATVSPNFPMNQNNRENVQPLPILPAVISSSATDFAPAALGMGSGPSISLIDNNNALRATVSPSFPMSQNSRETLQPLPIAPIAFRGFEPLNGSTVMPAA